MSSVLQLCTGTVWAAHDLGILSWKVTQISGMETSHLKQTTAELSDWWSDLFPGYTPRLSLSPCHCALVAVRFPIFPARSCRGRYERTAPSEVRGVTRGAFTAAAGKSCRSADSFMPFTSDGFPCALDTLPTGFGIEKDDSWCIAYRWGVREVLELRADVLQSGELVWTGFCVNVKPCFTGGRGVRRLKVGARLWWPPIDTDTH